MIYKKIDNDFYLKQLQVEDSEQLFQLVDKNREYLKEWLPWLNYNKSIEDSQKFIIDAKERYEGNKSFELGIWYKEKLAGVIGLHEIDWKNEKTAIGYWLGNDFQGHGLVSQAVQFVFDYCFKELKLKVIEIRCAVDNKKSRVIPEKLGLKFKGIKEMAESLYGKLVDHAIYEINLDDFIINQTN